MTVEFDDTVTLLDDAIALALRVVAEDSGEERPNRREGAETVVRISVLRKMAGV